MINILCFGDSNTFGMNPMWDTGQPMRHPYDVRWPGRLQGLLGEGYHVIEEGNNGRFTVFEDPSSPGKNGAESLPACIQSHKPLDLVIIMLGTNDCRPIHHVHPKYIGMCMERLVNIARDPANNFDYAPPQVLIVSPVPMNENAMVMGDIFMEDIEKTTKLAPEYKAVAERTGCGFLDLAPVARTSEHEGIHLMPDQHALVAQAMCDKIHEMGF